ncbi:MAG: hypothetical protein BGP12_17715 [Rhodospirillales bacterium 70-18]|nr:sulfotransferase [Rhodospirillales bacterium]OJY65690.1 MAG: hypothetical protein BGP12_17715 [Rhodospirillales bacterium 70-18]
MLGTLVRNDLRFVAVCSFGRSGSSYLMALLQAAGVQVADAMPFEDRALQISFIRWLAGEMEAAGPAANLAVAGAFGAEYYSTMLEGAADPAECEARLETRLAAMRGGWFAEKVIGTELLRMMLAFDRRDRIRPIYLLRDPRDIFISAKQFNARRGFRSFADDGDDRQMLHTICRFQSEQLWVHARSGGLLIHYEDLVARREQTIVSVLRHLGHEAITTARVAAIRTHVPVGGEAVRGHMTSATAQQSIRRWEAPEGAPYRALFAEATAALNASGYAG